jgi:hypothetical protein
VTSVISRPRTSAVAIEITSQYVPSSAARSARSIASTEAAASIAWSMHGMGRRGASFAPRGGPDRAAPDSAEASSRLDARPVRWTSAG